MECTKAPRRRATVNALLSKKSPPKTPLKPTYPPSSPSASSLCRPVSNPRDSCASSHPPRTLVLFSPLSSSSPLLWLLRFAVTLLIPPLYALWLRLFSVSPHHRPTSSYLPLVCLPALSLLASLAVCILPAAVRAHTYLPLDRRSLPIRLRTPLCLPPGKGYVPNSTQDMNFTAYHHGKSTLWRILSSRFNANVIIYPGAALIKVNGTAFVMGLGLYTTTTHGDKRRFPGSL